MNRLLGILSENASFSTEQLADMLGDTEESIKAQIKNYEDKKIIRAYQAVVDWEKVPNSYVNAVIELKVTPKKETGFDEVATRVMQFPEVESVYLMAGAYDLLLIVKGKTIQDVAGFVAKKLSALEGVISTATHFLLKRYKEDGVPLSEIVVQEEREGV